MIKIQRKEDFIIWNRTVFFPKHFNLKIEILNFQVVTEDLINEEGEVVKILTSFEETDLRMNSNYNL